MHQGVMLLSRGISTGQRNGLMRTLCSSMRGRTKCLSWGGTSPHPRMYWGLSSWEAAWPPEKALGILVDNRLDMSEQGALAAEKANITLGCVRRAGSRWEGDPAPLLSTVASPGLSSMRDMDLLEKVQQKPQR